MIEKRFGRWIVLERVSSPVKSNDKYWRCMCDCGNIGVISQHSLIDGSSSSCGCLRNDVMSIIKKKYNRYDLFGEIGIGFTFKNEEFYFDLEDYDLIKDYCWSLDSNDYVVSYSPFTKRKVEMEDIILIKSNKKIRIDHENKIRWDNRKSNLRFATHKQNNYNKGIRSNNTSGITGISPNRNAWDVSLSMNGKVVFRKYCLNFEEAVRERLLAEKKYFGEFAPQKDLFKEYGIDE